MKKNTIAIEISHKFIKIAFGFVQDERVYLNYVKKVNINHLLENGAIKEKNELIKELSRVNPVVDQEYLVNYLINNVSFVLPPYGLEVYQTSQLTSVTSPEKEIGEIDIVNLYSMIRNKKLPVDNVLIDIIPESFAIDNGNMYAQAPLGKFSSAITAHAKVYTVPRRIDEEYSGILKAANIQIKRKVASTFASSELLASYKDVPQTYFLVDIGSDSTSVSLVGNKTLFATRTFSWGGDKITDRIISAFNISEKDAEKIKIMFGLDKRELKFNYVVSSNESEFGDNKHIIDELNSIIENELNEFYKSFIVAIDELCKAYNVSDYTKLPLLLIGGGSKLKGLVPFLADKSSFNDIRLMTPNSIGGRDPSLFGVLGAIYIEHKYPSMVKVNKTQTSNVSREE